jgi:DNA gyrase subunit A
MKTSDKSGVLIGALTVQETDELMLITSGGQMVRTFVKDIRETGRNTMGVKLIELEAGDRLQAIAPVINEETAEVEPAPQPPPEPLST